MSTRIDEFRFNSSKAPKKDGNGFLDLPEIIASTAGVFTYRENGKTIRELKPEEEIFSPESIESLKNVPMSIEHIGGILTPETVGKHGVGSVGDNIRQNSTQVLVSGKVTDAKGIEAVEKYKLNKISPAYTQVTKQESGVHKKHGPYDRIQTQIRYNHITLTLMGREPDASIRMNSDAYMVDEQTPQSEEKLMKIKKNIPEFQVGEARLNSKAMDIEPDQASDFDSLVQDIAVFANKAKEEHSAMSAKLNTFEELSKGELEKSQKEVARLNSELEEQKQMPEVLAVAKERLNSEEFEKVKSLDVLGIKKAVLAKSGISEERMNSEDFHAPTAWDFMKTQKPEKSPAYSPQVDPKEQSGRMNSNPQGEKDALAQLTT